MSTESALGILRTYRDGILNITLIETIETLVRHANELSDKQAQEVYSALWGVAWDRRFIADTPHDSQNPGLVADRHKGNFRREDTLSGGAVAAVIAFLGGR